MKALFMASEPFSALSVREAEWEDEGGERKKRRRWRRGDQKSAITSVLDSCLPGVNNYV